MDFGSRYSTLLTFKPQYPHTNSPDCSIYNKQGQTTYILPQLIASLSPRQWASYKINATDEYG